MLKRALSLLKAVPERLLSCLKAAPKIAYTQLKNIPKLILACARSIPGAMTLLFKLSAGAMVLGLLAISLANSLPGPMVSSIQVEKNLPKLEEAKKYDPNRAVVRLYRGDQFFCSGVVIGKNYVLTASHCLIDEYGRMNKQAVTVVNDDGSVRVASKPSGVNLRMDWGLLEGDFDEIPAAIVVEVGFQPPPAVIACGYPQGAQMRTCQILQPMMNDGFLIKCRVGGMLFPGMSGGPVFDQNGYVVGLNVLVYPAESGGGVAYTPTTGILANFHIAD